MIELKNVTKVYSSKSKTTTTALNNVSLKLPNKGMTFILGKSGCGKSTLLNLIGGLDSVTSGNIIVNKKDITTLTDKEYDAYRNSIVGIVFQEFNLLDEYNVYENIVIANELQNKETKRDEVLALLEKLDLSGLEERRINELSGGQKQRVAIARALIKKPSILLCDEPTGNLDSKSSKQIFEILKDISKDILVVVVSHDVESANNYGDDIIELVDGEVSSTTIKNVKDDNKGLTLINSVLPFKYVKKIALKSLYAKPIKLFMTVLITSIAVLFMGIGMNITLFDQKQLIYETMVDLDSYSFTFEKFVKKGAMYGNPPFKDKDIETIRSNIGNNELNYVYNIYVDDDIWPFKFNFNDQDYIENILRKDTTGVYRYFNSSIGAIDFVEVKDDSLFNNIIGSAPKNNQEIVVHKYFADYIIKFGIYDKDNNLYKPNSIEELIASKTLYKIGNYHVYISGVIDDNKDEYMEAYENDLFDEEKLYNKFQYLYRDVSNRVYVKGFVDNYDVPDNKDNILKAMRFAIQDFNNNNIYFYNDEISVVTKDGEKVLDSLDIDDVILSYNDFKIYISSYDERFNIYASDFVDLPLLNIQKNFVQKCLNELDYTTELIYYKDGTKTKTLNVVGVSFDGNSYISYGHTEMYVSLDKTKKYFIVHEDDKKELKKIINYFDIYDLSAKDGTYLMFVPPLSIEIGTVSDLHYYFGYIAFAVTVVFTLFTIFVFTNFISVSISYSRKKIGILKALGASNKDVLKIFGYESAMIAITSWFVGMVLVFIGDIWINNMVKINSYLSVNIIGFHPLTPIVMLIHTLVISLFITFISLSYVTKVKPIDSILEK